MSRRTRIVSFGLLGIAGLAVIAFVAAILVVRTDWFRNKVRAKIASVAETASGGRAEIGNFDYNWHTLTAEVAPFILHGKESPSSPPFFRADRIRIGLKIVS